MKLLFDGIAFQLGQSIAYRFWAQILQSMARNDDIDLQVLDRGGLPPIDGLRRWPFPSYSGAYLPADSLMIQRVSDMVGAEIFLSSAWTTPMRTPSVMIVSDTAFREDCHAKKPWLETRLALRHAVRHLCMSPTALSRLRSANPDLPPSRSSYVPPGGEPVTAARPGAKEQAQFKQALRLNGPLFLIPWRTGGPLPLEMLDAVGEGLVQVVGAPVSLLCLDEHVEKAVPTEAAMAGRASIAYALPTPELLSIAYCLAEAMIVPPGLCQREMFVAEAQGSACHVIEIGETRDGGSANNHLIPDIASLAATFGAALAGKQGRNPIKSAMTDTAARERQAFSDELVRLLRESLAEHKTGVNDAFYVRWEELRLIQGEVEA
jgi:hypothetical protein